MTKITRPDINVQGFASSPQSQERTTFGTETESTNLADFLTPEFLRGWGVLPVGGKPPYQWFNGAVYLISQLQAMQFQQGVPEYALSQEFHRNGLTAKNGVLYRSKTDSNTGNDPETDSTNWQPQTAMVPGTKNVSDIDANGVLELTIDDGKYITLTGHGAADVEITGFGDQLPVGYEFELIIPRTFPDTGNTPNTLGNFVQFTHTAGVDGLDMTMNKRMVNGSPVFNYQSYSNFSDADGNACNLDERVKFVQTSQANGGRAALVKLPDVTFGENTQGSYLIGSKGNATLTRTETQEWSGTSISLPYPIPVTIIVFVKGQLNMSTSPSLERGYMSEFTARGTSVSWSAFMVDSTATGPAALYAECQWKPQV